MLFSETAETYLKKCLTIGEKISNDGGDDAGMWLKRNKGLKKIHKVRRLILTARLY